MAGPRLSLDPTGIASNYLHGLLFLSSNICRILYHNMAYGWPISPVSECNTKLHVGACATYPDLPTLIKLF